MEEQAVSEDLRDLVSPFRLYDHPTMYQPLPNVQKDDEKVRPTEPPTPKEPQKDDAKKDKDKSKQK
jgi:hypothetical protein